MDPSFPPLVHRFSQSLQLAAMDDPESAAQSPSIHCNFTRQLKDPRVHEPAPRLTPNTSELQYHEYDFGSGGPDGDDDSDASMTWAYWAEVHDKPESLSSGDSSFSADDEDDEDYEDDECDEGESEDDEESSFEDCMSISSDECLEGVDEAFPFREGLEGGDEDFPFCDALNEVFDEWEVYLSDADTAYYDGLDPESDDGDAEEDEGMDEDEDDSITHDIHTGGTTPLTDAKINSLKRLVLLTYPTSRFLLLPQIKRLLSLSSKESMLYLLEFDLWLLKVLTKNVQTVGAITTFSFSHFNDTMQQILEIFFGGRVGSVKDYDYSMGVSERGSGLWMAALSQKHEETIRGLVREVFKEMHVFEIIDRLVPGGSGNEAFLAELYGSAVLFGGVNGEGFGLDAEVWWGMMGRGQ